MLELRAERILLALDYPFEDMAEVSDWLDQLPISDTDCRKIGSENAASLLNLSQLTLSAAVRDTSG